MLMVIAHAWPNTCAKYDAQEVNARGVPVDKDSDSVLYRSERYRHWPDTCCTLVQVKIRSSALVHLPIQQAEEIIGQRPLLLDQLLSITLCTNPFEVGAQPHCPSARGREVYWLVFVVS